MTEPQQNITDVELVIIPEYNNQPAYLFDWDDERQAIAVFPPDMTDKFREIERHNDDTGPYVKIYNSDPPAMIRTGLKAQVIADYDVTYHGGRAQIDSLKHHIIFRDFGCTFDRGQRVEHPAMAKPNRIAYIRVVEDQASVRLLIGGDDWSFKAAFGKDTR